jgi:hypothetical protein
VKLSVEGKTQSVDSGKTLHKAEFIELKINAEQFLCTNKFKSSAEEFFMHYKLTSHLL